MLTATIITIVLLVIAAFVLLRRRLNRNAITTLNSQPTSGALPTPPVSVDDESEFDVKQRMSYTPPAPIFVTAIPRDAHTLAVSFALPPGTLTPDGVEVLVNETERHDFAPQDEYIIEGLEPGTQVGVQVRIYNTTDNMLDGGVTFGGYSDACIVTMPERERDTADDDFRNIRLSGIGGERLRMYPFDFEFGYGRLDSLKSFSPIPPAVSLSEREKRSDETEQERAERVFGDFVDTDGNGVDDRFEQDALARLGDEGGIVRDDDIHNTHSGNTGTFTPVVIVLDDAVKDDEREPNEDESRFDGEGGAMQSTNYEPNGEGWRLLPTFGGAGDFGGAGASGSWEPKFYPDADTPAVENPSDVNDSEMANADSNSDATSGSDTSSDTDAGGNDNTSTSD